eukprot:51561_1
MVKYSTITSVVYCIVYGLLFLITSIHAFTENEPNTNNSVEISSHNTRQTDGSGQTEQIELNIIKAPNTASSANTHLENRNQEKQEKQPNINSFEYKFKLLQKWVKSIYRKKKIYCAVLIHIADQATDLGVLIIYYNEYINYDNTTDTFIDTFWFFWISIFIIIIHKIVSTITMFQLTNNIKSAFLQFIDLLLVRAMWINWKLDLTEPCNPQRYIHLLEAVFESTPQILLSIGYILKQYVRQTNIDPIVIASTLFSLWSLVSSVTSDDTIIFIRCVYLVRIILWRLFEITSRICLLIFFWINVGGFALVIMLAVECISLIIFGVFEKTPEIMGNLMFISFGMNKGYVRYFYYYRIISFYLFITIVTIFSSIDFKTDKIPNYQQRHNITIENSLGFSILCLTWICGFISHMTLVILIKTDHIDDGAFDLTWTYNVREFGQLSSTSRDLIGYSKTARFSQLKELFLFGVKSTSQHVDTDGRTLLYYACREVDDMELFELFFKANPNLINTKDNSGDTPLHCAAAYVNIGAIKYLVNHNANVNEMNNDKQTPIIRAAEFNRPTWGDVIKYLIQCGAEIYRKDIYGKSVLYFAEAYETRYRFTDHEQAGQNKDIIEMLEKRRREYLVAGYSMEVLFGERIIVDVVNTIACFIDDHIFVNFENAVIP